MKIYSIEKRNETSVTRQCFYMQPPPPKKKTNSKGKDVSCLWRLPMVPKLLRELRMYRGSLCLFFFKITTLFRLFADFHLLLDFPQRPPVSDPIPKWLARYVRFERSARFYRRDFGMHETLNGLHRTLIGLHGTLNDFHYMLTDLHCNVERFAL